VLLDTIEIPGTALGVYVVGSYAYVATGEGLVIVDIGDFLAS